MCAPNMKRLIPDRLYGFQHLSSNVRPPGPASLPAAGTKARAVMAASEVGAPVPRSARPVPRKRRRPQAASGPHGPLERARSSPQGAACGRPQADEPAQPERNVFGPSPGTCVARRSDRPGFKSAPPSRRDRPGFKSAPLSRRNRPGFKSAPLSRRDRPGFKPAPLSRRDRPGRGTNRFRRPVGDRRSAPHRGPSAHPRRLTGIHIASVQRDCFPPAPLAGKVAAKDARQEHRPAYIPDAVDPRSLVVEGESARPLAEPGWGLTSSSATCCTFRPAFGVMAVHGVATDFEGLGSLSHPGGSWSPRRSFVLQRRQTREPP